MNLKRETINIINSKLESLSDSLKMKIIIDEKSFKSFNSFFLLLYNSESYLKSRTISDALVGNYPILIDKENENLYVLKDRTIDLNLNYNIQDLLENNIIDIWK